jgi:hypothetical protein
MENLTKEQLFILRDGLRLKLEELINLDNKNNELIEDKISIDLIEQSEYLTEQIHITNLLIGDIEEVL